MQTYDSAIRNSSSSNNITDTDVDVDVDTMPAGCPPMPPLPAVGEVGADGRGLAYKSCLMIMGARGWRFDNFQLFSWF